MTQGMDGDALLADAGVELSGVERALNTAFGHGCCALFRPLAVTPKCREEKQGVSISNPVAAQESKGCMGQGNIAVLCPRAPMHMNHYAVAFDIGDFQMKPFLTPGTARTASKTSTHCKCDLIE